ncbi:hypothetical protein GOC83_07445 [Haloarcula rubripromontorii]|uniref:Uncharacterized protein n=1 Tax=Haloarcula rubripromontorii TaxID=1705562 RepID=A0A847TZN4_9EURY|nr:hypothetical protein [Haloarcula rubripromontorii]NLV05966.1 hypothetical protein [Haloarcula rubripromontorii]
MSTDSLPAKYDVVRSASAGVDKKEIHLKDLQLSSGDINEIVNIEDGDFLKVVSEHGSEQFQIYCRVEERDNSFSSGIENGEVGLGLPVREALAVDPEYNDTVTLKQTEFKEISRRRQLFNKLLGYRPVPLRVRRAVHPDPGQKVARTTEAVRQILGIEWGDKVVLQSSDARVRDIKALPLTDQQQQKIKSRQEDESSPYPPRFSKTELGERTGTRTDIPIVHLSASIRDDLELTDYGTKNGIYQPIKMHRDTRDLFFRLSDSLTIPFLLSVAAIVIGFQVSLGVRILTMLIGFLTVVLSVVYRSRQVLLN